ncbi:hypothetical protein PHYPSEUDO_012851, partial [Phytophthora pseudosyringae]
EDYMLNTIYCSTLAERRRSAAVVVSLVPVPLARELAPHTQAAYASLRQKAHPFRSQGLAALLAVLAW